MTIPVLHNNEIHYPDPDKVMEQPGSPVATRMRSVVCPCGRAGTMPSPGWVNDTVQSWARLNRYTVHQDGDGQWRRVL